MAETSRRGNAKGSAASGKKRAEVQDNPELLGSDEVRTAFVSGLTYGPKAVQYAVVDGRAIFEGDIDLGSVEDVTQADASSVVIAESVLDDLTADQAAVAEVEVGEVDPRADLVVGSTWPTLVGRPATSRSVTSSPPSPIRSSRTDTVTRSSCGHVSLDRDDREQLRVPDPQPGRRRDRATVRL